MKETEGIPKPYSSLRLKNPSIYYLEDFYYKILQLNIDKDYNAYLENTELDEDGIVTLNFPEFLDVSYNLDLIKKVFFEVDLCFSVPGDITLDKTEGPLSLVKVGDEVNDYLPEPDYSEEYIPFPERPDYSEEYTPFPERPLSLVKVGDKVNDHLPEPVSIFSSREYTPFPEGMLTLYFGYSFTAVQDVRGHLEGTESLCCDQLVKMENDCFTWIPISRNTKSLEQVTTKPSVCKFRVDVSLPLLREWFEEVLTPNRFSYFVDAMGANSVDINFIMHPPYIDRMSFKDSIKIIYPLKTTKLKVIDKISFRTNRSYVVNNKLYFIDFIDKDTNQKLFSFNSVDQADLFSNMINKVNTKTINSYLDEEVKTFEDRTIVDFSIPNPVQMSLSRHNNYKIRITAKDLTTQNRGSNGNSQF